MIKSRKVTVAGVNSPVTVFKVMNTHGYYTELCNYGASVLSIIVPDRNGDTGDVVLGYPGLTEHIKDGPYMGKTLGRFAGRIAKGKFTLNNHSYQLEVNNGTNHLHGGSYGLSFRLWECQEAGENTIRFKTVAKANEDGYPGDVEIVVEYNWSEDNVLTVTYQGIPTEDTLLNLSNHSYFNLQGTTTVLDHQLKIEADHYFPLNLESIPESSAQPVTNTPMDFRNFCSIGRQMDCTHPQLAIDRGYNHCWALRPECLNTQTPAVELYSPENGRILRIFSDYPGAVIYCGNYFDGLQQDKQHRPLDAYAGVAIEMQYYPDSPNMSQAPSCVVRKGEKSVHQIRYCFELLS